MNDIRVIEKPDLIPWDDVAKCIFRGQATNNSKGFDMTFGHISGVELQKSVNGGHCFVAINEQNEIVGTLSVTFGNIKFWWHKGPAALYCYEAILPEFRNNLNRYFGLHKMAEDCIKHANIKVVWATTAEQNETMLKINKIKKWKFVQYSPTVPGSNYYSIVMAKWLEGCPYKDCIITFMFKLSRFVVRFLYKPGKVFRFSLKKK